MKVGRCCLAVQETVSLEELFKRFSGQDDTAYHVIAAAESRYHFYPVFPGLQRIGTNIDFGNGGCIGVPEKIL